MKNKQYFFVHQFNFVALVQLIDLLQPTFQQFANAIRGMCIAR